MAFQRTYGLCWLVNGLPRPPRAPRAPSGTAASAGGGGLSAAAEAADLNAATCAANASMIDLRRVSESSTSLFTHACAQLAPKAEVINPMGCLIAFCKLREKKYAMAEKPGTVSGVQTCHLPATSSSGSSLVFSGTRNSRILGQLAAAISCASLATPAKRWACPGYLAMSLETTKSMFDCPDPSQTSPTRISTIRIVFLAAIVISIGSFDARRLVSRTIHFRSVPA